MNSAFLITDDVNDSFDSILMPFVHQKYHVMKRCLNDEDICFGKASLIVIRVSCDMFGLSGNPSTKNDQ